jgi:hypothetical protein
VRVVSVAVSAAITFDDFNNNDIDLVEFSHQHKL